MKKTIILALAMALPVMAGDDKGSTVKVVEYPPVVTPAPAADCPWAVEIAGVHTWTMADAGDDMHNINTWGVDTTVLYNINDNWAATLRFGWAQGDDSAGLPGGIIEREITNWSLTAGVRYTAPITDKLSWFAAATLGWGRTEIENKADFGPNEVFEADADGDGLYYSAEIGLKYTICQDLYATGAAGVRGIWNEPKGSLGDRYDQQFGISVSAGLGWDF